MVFNLRFIEAQNILNSCCYLIGNLNYKLKSLGDEFVKPFISSLSLTLKALSLVINCCDESEEARALVTDRRERVFATLNDALKIWIKCVVGGDCFGCKIRSYYSWNTKEFEKAKEEFEVRHHMTVYCVTYFVDSCM